MDYKSGNYRVRTTMVMAPSFASRIYDWHTSVFYDNKEIVNSRQWKDEASALEWARTVIAEHKAKLDALKEIVNGTSV